MPQPLPPESPLASTEDDCELTDRGHRGARPPRHRSALRSSAPGMRITPRGRLSPCVDVTIVFTTSRQRLCRVPERGPRGSRYVQTAGVAATARSRSSAISPAPTRFSK